METNPPVPAIPGWIKVFIEKKGWKSKVVERDFGVKFDTFFGKYPQHDKV